MCEAPQRSRGHTLEEESQGINHSSSIESRDNDCAIVSLCNKVEKEITGVRDICSVLPAGEIVVSNVSNNAMCVSEAGVVEADPSVSPGSPTTSEGVSDGLASVRRHTPVNSGGLASVRHHVPICDVGSRNVSVNLVEELSIGGCDTCTESSTDCKGAAWLCVKMSPLPGALLDVAARNDLSASAPQVKFTVYEQCTAGRCECRHSVGNAPAPLRPCRAYVECFLRGGTDPDWAYIMHGITFGFKVVNQDCPSSYIKENYTSATGEDVKDKLSAKLKAEIASGAISIVPEPPRCVHALGTVPKDGGGMRVIVDCSAPGEDAVNLHTNEVCIKFGYHSVDTVTEMMESSDLLATVDISDAYRYVSIDTESSDFQGISWEWGGERVFLRDNRLSMGLSSSPYVFSKISDFVVRCAMRRGCSRIVNYLDDYCILGRSVEECVRDQQHLIAALRMLGFAISFKKLSSPSTSTRFLGIIIDSVKMNLSLPRDKLEKLLVDIHKTLSGRKVDRKQLEQLAGYMAHASKVVRGGRVFSRRVYDTISSLKKAHHKIRVGGEFKKDLLWWRDFATQFNGAANILGSAAPMQSTYSDSSTSWGFGVLHGNDWAAGPWSLEKERDRKIKDLLGHHYEEPPTVPPKDDNINVLELWPVLVAVKRWGESWDNKTICMVTDNTQVMAALRTGRSKNTTSMAWLRKIFWESVTRNFQIRSVYIKSADNVICDSLSRLDKKSSATRLIEADPGGYLCCSHLFVSLQGGNS